MCVQDQVDQGTTLTLCISLGQLQCVPYLVALW